MSLPGQTTYQFDDFELQPTRRLMLRGGERIAIAPKSFEVLLCLVQRAGQVVLKEELLRTVWPDSFVEESNLTQQIFSLRKALTDKASYIVTIPGRGYEFVGTVTILAHPASESVVSSGVAQRRDPEQPDVTFEETTSMPIREPAPVSRHWGVRVLLGVAVAAIAWVGGAGLWRRAHRPVPRDHHEVVLADFTNTTGDAVFDETLKQGLSLSLRQSPYLALLSEGKVAATLRQMTQPPGTPITPALARQVCQRAGSQAYVAGAIATLGTEYVIGLKATDCATGDLIDQEQVTAAAREDVLARLGEAASRLRARLGESPVSIRKFDVPLIQATTPSLEALREYTLGVKISRTKGPAADIPYLERAIQIDPSFAMAYRAMAVELYGLGETERASAYSSKAFELSGHASERETLAIKSNYYNYVVGDRRRGAETLETLAAEFPGGLAYTELVNTYVTLGEFDKAVAAGQRGFEVQPSWGALYGSWLNALLDSQQFDRARQVAANAQPAKDDLVFHIALYALGFLTDDKPAMEEHQNWLIGQPDAEFYGWSLAADTAAYTGHLVKARDLTRRSIDAAVKAGTKEGGALQQDNAALREAAFGNRPEALREAAAALKLVPKSLGVEAEAALAFALAGQTARAQTMGQALERSYPQDLQIQKLWLPAIEGQIALDRDDPTAALAALQPASPPMEFATIPFNVNGSCLLPTYLRGQALLATGQGAAAEPEFRKILDHAGVVWNCWTAPLARLGLARSYALQARGAADPANADAKTRAAYEVFLQLWKDADPGIPVLQQARKEYAALPH